MLYYAAIWYMSLITNLNMTCIGHTCDGPRFDLTSPTRPVVVSATSPDTVTGKS